MMAVGGFAYCASNKAWLPSPDQSTNSGLACSPGGGNVVIA
jgi:hypothetical protein